MTRPLSLAVVCYPHLGGSGIIAVDLAVGLASRGHRVRVLASARPKAAMPELASLSFEQIPGAEYPLFDHSPYTLDVAAKIVEVAGMGDLDLVHLHYAIPHSASALLARHALGDDAPIFVTTLHGTDVSRLGNESGYRAVIGRSVASCDGVTTPSIFLRDEARRRLELEDDTAIEVIANFVDTARFAPPGKRDARRLGELIARNGVAPSGPFLFHVSNFRPVKRCTELIDIIARVRESLPAHLVLVGDGPDRAAVAGRIRELGMQPHVTFLGEHTDFVEMLGQADAFVLPSQNESFGVAALEALSCGVPVFGYDVGGLSEVVTDDCGTLVDAFDLSALAQAIVATMSDGAALAKARRAARDRALRCFQKDEIVGHYELFYRKLLNRERQR